MAKRIYIAALAVALVLVAAQFIRPNQTNPPVIASHTIAAHEGAGSQLAAVLDRACSDCHSNSTVWPSYAQIAPLSWLMAYGVEKGREAVNFSEWEGYSTAERSSLLELACRDVSNGTMPGAYTLLHPQMRLSPEDIETVCAAARQANAAQAQALQ